MELHPQARGFQIKDAKIPITIALRTLASLKAHEEVVREELASLSSSIQSDQVLRHPLIADVRTGIILDGTHRLLALKRLGYHSAPVALVDYQSPTIIIDRWYRLIERTTMEDAMTILENLNFQRKEMAPETADGQLEARRAVAVIRDNERAFTFAAPAGVLEPLEMARAGFRIERALREAGHAVGYVDSRPEALHEDTLILSMVKLRKQDVVDTAMAGRLYPPKSTRHLVPSRPLGTRVPVDWLASEDLEATQSKLMHHLRSMTLTRLAEGSTVGSRHYAEEVFLFG